MRVVILFLLLVILAFIGFKAYERHRAAAPAAPPGQEAPAAPSAPAETELAPALPSFDIVRVDRSGYAVIAGRAAPAADVVVYANGVELAAAKAESDGSWAMNTDTPLDAGPVELTLTMKTPDGVVIKSDQTILIYVPQRPGDRPLVLRTTPGGATEVLQDPRDDGVGLGPLSLDAIDYDDSGAVIFSGRAEPGRDVQIFANGQFVAQTSADESGRWQASASMPPGVFTLVIVQLDANGRPAYAIELPFERASFDEIQLRDGKVIVQPGNSLWKIARRVYGSGFQYTIIYEANADQIRDPDLIYPGQIFDVPEEAPAQ
jgi:nucleoid-associated protein YgaU